MKKPLLAVFLSAAALFPLAKAQAFDPNYIISDEEMTDSTSLDLEQIQAFLGRGYLGNLVTEDFEGKKRSAAEIIWRAARMHGINPKFLLVLLQKEQSLIEDDSPTQKQLDWATGYAVCDNCSMNDPIIQRWKGFGKQVNSAALQFMEGYMDDIENTGRTAYKYGPGIAIMIDGTQVVPGNAATAALYAYTPHIHGNQNFARLWNEWFGRDYPNGTLLQAAGEDGVWLMQNGYRRPITSASALHSRFNAKLIVPVSKDVLERFPTGRPISLPNYTLVKDETGKIYLLVDDALRYIESMEIFRSIGFSEDEVIDITGEEVAQYDVGLPITTTSVFPTGRLLRLSSGTVYFIENGVRHQIFDESVLKAKFPNSPLIDALPVEVEQYKEGKPVKLPDGYLIKSPESPAVFVISDGYRRLIPSEKVFTAFGYEWANVITVPTEVVNLHPLGDELHEAIEDEVNVASVTP